MFDEEQYALGRAACIEFYKQSCCNSEVLPDNPNSPSTPQFYSWNSGWNSHFPICTKVCGQKP